MVDAVAEATWHDNIKVPTATHDNADGEASKALADTFAIGSSISVAEAVIWAQTYPDEVTLYLYDQGKWGHDEG